MRSSQAFLDSFVHLYVDPKENAVGYCTHEAMLGHIDETNHHERPMNLQIVIDELMSCNLTEKMVNVGCERIESDVLAEISRTHTPEHMNLLRRNAFPKSKEFYIVDSHMMLL